MRWSLLVLMLCLSFPSCGVAAEHAAYMELPPEYRAWFRNPDGSCAAPETPVLTTSGQVPICELRPERDAICYLADDGTLKATHWYEVFPTKRVSSLVRLEAQGGHLLRVTPDHRIGIRDALAGRLSFVAAEKLAPCELLATWPSGTAPLTSVSVEQLADPLEVWDIQNFEACWQREGNFFACGVLVHNCVQCSNGMVGMHINRPEWTYLLWDTEYGPAERRGSWPGRVAEYARKRGMKIFNVTGNSYEDTRPWMLWAAQTNRFCAIGAGGSHFQTLYGYVPGDPKPWKVCNNNSTHKIDEYTEEAFERLHMASGPWVVVPDEPAPAPPPRLVPWWQ